MDVRTFKDRKHSRARLQLGNQEAVTRDDSFKTLGPVRFHLTSAHLI